MNQPGRSWIRRLSLVLALALMTSSAVARTPDTSPRETEAAVTRVTASLLGSSQLAHHPLDEQLAGKLLDRYMDALDGTRSLLLGTDLDELAPMRATLAQKTRVDGDTQAAHLIFARYLQRLRQKVEFETRLLRTERFTFTDRDRILIDRTHEERPRDLAAAQALWRQQLRAEVLEEKLAVKPPKDIAATLIKRHEQQLKTMSALGNEEVLEMYLDALAHVYDPHSDYLDKESMASFSISMNLSLFGIGAALGTEDGLCTVRELVPGGPAALSGALKPGDRIVAVAQDGQAAVDVTSMRLTRIVELIRGPRGSIVTLTILPATGARKTVRLTRAEVKLEDQQAKARIVDLPRPGAGPLRLGVIDLPSFYAGNGDDRSAHGATADVARLLTKLQEEKVRGVVLDLRRNGGGSLQEAIELTSLFIGNGPVVQTRDAKGAIQVEANKHAKVSYTGPLVVLTSKFSASASEIVAGALQDYGRAVVVGDSSTFGKGTVQTIMPLGAVMDQVGVAHASDPGALKVTVSKFYRPSGASTELRGVASDIVIAAASGLLPVGEDKLDDPLPWDTIASTPYKGFSAVAPHLTALRDASARRVAADPAFDDLRKQLARLKSRLDSKAVSLNEAERRREQAEDKALAKATAAKAEAMEAGIPAYEITVKGAGLPGLPAAGTGAATPPTGAAASKRGANKEEAEAEAAQARAADNLVLDESLRILADYVGLLSAPRSQTTGIVPPPRSPRSAANDANVR